MGIIDSKDLAGKCVNSPALHHNIFLLWEGWKMGTGLPEQKLAPPVQCLPTALTPSFFNVMTTKIAPENPCKSILYIGIPAARKIEDLLAGSINGHFINLSSLSTVRVQINAPSTITWAYRIRICPTGQGGLLVLDYSSY